MDYYKNLFYIAQVDEKDTITGKVERWEAHEKGILHRAFTVAIFYQGKVVIQHRKHPVFDDVYDVTVSSHQIYVHDKLQDDLEAVYPTLQREFGISQQDLLSPPVYKGNIYYKAPDPKSRYIEHEVCHIYTCEVKNLPQPNLDFAYGSLLASIEELKDKNSSLYSKLAPWVQECLKTGLL